MVLNIGYNSSLCWMKLNHIANFVFCVKWAAFAAKIDGDESGHGNDSCDGNTKEQNDVVFEQIHIDIFCTPPN